MGSKIKIYLDTSVISALFDNRNPERQELTRIFFEKIDIFDVYVSEVVFAEIDNLKDIDLKDKFKDVVIGFKILQIDEESRKLAKHYVKQGAIPSEYSEDALHIAISTLNEIDYLLSWNFRHIVKVKTRRIVNITNLSLGYPDLKIATPAELI
ncbi:MAG: type II toxin-antitoxin system VapC family toxin [Candidatus Helarchaeota archaeon]|nr:type II toxin-antitoxin system VapC family toxin [Candidatus Helarchaeota archaeon]